MILFVLYLKLYSHYSLSLSLGYQNITLTSIPQSVYTITSRLSVLSCRASGYSSSSGTTEPLDVVFFRNESPMTNKYHMPSRHFYTTDDGLTATGLVIDPTRLEDNDVKFKCKVFINQHIVNVSSPQVTIIVAGKGGREGGRGRIKVHVCTCHQCQS